MSKRHWKFIPFKDEQDWHLLRRNGIGGSEVGAAMGISKYQSRLSLYLEKIGEPVPQFQGNRFSNFGKLFEDVIAKLYCYWQDDGDVNDMFRNLWTGKRTHRVRQRKAILVNDRFPWLFGTIDRQVVNDPRGRVLFESKNTTSMEARTYVNGFNPSFYAQVQDYLLLGEFPQGDIGTLLDGNDMRLTPVMPDERWFEAIVEDTKEVWERIEKARALKERWKIESYYGVNIEFIKPDQRGAIYELQSLEPELTGHEEERDVIRELVIPTEEATSMNGTPEQLAMVEQYGSAQESKAAAENALEAVKNRMILSLGGIHEALFPEGKFSFKPTKTGVKKLYVAPGLIRKNDETD